MLTCSTMATSSIRDLPVSWQPMRRGSSRLLAPALKNGNNRAEAANTFQLELSLSSARILGIEPVLGAHFVDDRDILAAGDQAHDRRGYVPAAQMRFDDIGLAAAISGVRTLRVHHGAIIDRFLGDDGGEFCPSILRRAGIAQRRRDGVDNHLLFLGSEIALCNAGRHNRRAVRAFAALRDSGAGGATGKRQAGRHCGDYAEHRSLQGSFAQGVWGSAATAEFAPRFETRTAPMVTWGGDADPAVGALSG